MDFGASVYNKTEAVCHVGNQRKHDQTGVFAANLYFANQESRITHHESRITNRECLLATSLVCKHARASLAIC